MITRFVPSCAGSGSVSKATHDDMSTTARRPDELLRQAHASSLAGIFTQIAAVAAHSFEIFTELRDESARLDAHFQRLQARVTTVAVLAGVSERNADACDPSTYHLPTREERDSVLRVPETSFSHPQRRSAAVAEAYARCEPMPPLELLDEFVAATQPASSDAVASARLMPPSSVSRQKYSHPGFFVDEWMKHETSRQQRVLEAKEDRRRERRELKRGPSPLALQQQQQSNQQSARSGSTNYTLGPEVESKSKASSSSSGGAANRFLKIRSWREIYGTGEGKELARDQKERAASVPAAVVENTGSLEGEKKSSRKMLDTAAAIESHACESVESLHAPSSPSALLASDDDVDGGLQYDLGGYQIDYSLYPPPPPPLAASTATPCSGAFMQEIGDDDDVFSDFDGTSFEQLDARALTTNATDVDGFVDHGLSYYYDPAIALHQLVPPPPPPLLPLDDEDDSENDREYEPALSEVPECDESMDAPDFVPPPPPLPPPSTLFELQVGHTVESTHALSTQSRPFSSLLHEIQRGASLRNIQITEECDGDSQDTDSVMHHGVRSGDTAAAPTLLEQIKMKQRGLRPVPLQLPRRSAIASRHAAPFADSIARILERRSVIAYDSDSSDSGKSATSDTEW